MKSSSAEHVTDLIERIGRLLNADAHSSRLLPVQWEALRYLDKANRFSRTAGALTAYLGITKGTVSQTVKALEVRGLVTKLINNKDRRSKHLSITAKGKSVLRKDPLAATVATVELLDKTTQSWLCNGLESLLTLRLSAQKRQAFGQCRDCRYFARQHVDGGPHFCRLLGEKLAEPEAQKICYEQLPA